MLFGISSSSSDFESTSSRPKKRQQIKQQQQLKLPYTASYNNNNNNTNTTAASANNKNCFINVIESTQFDVNKKTDKKFPKIPSLVNVPDKNRLHVHNLSPTTNANTDHRTAIVHKSKNCQFNNKTAQISNVKCVTISENVTVNILPDSKTIKTNRFYSSRLPENLKTFEKTKRYISPHIADTCIRVTTIESNEFSGCKTNCVDVDTKVSDGKHLTFTNKQFRLTDDTDANKTNSKPNLVISRRNQISKTQFLNDCGMDRSVDSIGSCSLDVDADSTDFSGIFWSGCCCFFFFFFFF